MPNHDKDAYKASSAFVSNCLLHYCTLLISTLVLFNQMHEARNVAN